MRNQGFTLVEILIVVIILGILAAIVIPQFTEASNDARESALANDLQTVRSQMELYRVQHLEKYPFELAGEDSDDVVEQMSKHTNAAGEVMPDDGDVADYKFGPYLQSFPSNAFVSGDGAEPAGISFGTDDPAPGDGTTGWYLNTSTGKFSANSDKTKYPLHIEM